MQEIFAEMYFQELKIQLSCLEFNLVPAGHTRYFDACSSKSSINPIFHIVLGCYHHAHFAHIYTCMYIGGPLVKDVPAHAAQIFSIRFTRRILPVLSGR